MFIDGDFFESLADFSYGDHYTKKYTPSVPHLEQLHNQLNRTLLLFINTERILELLDIVRLYKKEVIIITHNSDIILNDSIIKHIPSNCIRLWSQNYNGSINDKIKPLPIGLERKRWFPEQKKQEVIESNIGKLIKKDIHTYMNFDTKTNPIRKQWFESLKDKKFVKVEMLGNGKDYNGYINNLKRSRFVLSPPGNGIDCHRNWECLYLGVIPIIQRSNFTIQMFSDLNVILIDNISEITEEKLNEYNPKTNNEKLDTNYWETIIKKDITND